MLLCNLSRMACRLTPGKSGTAHDDGRVSLNHSVLQIPVVSGFSILKQSKQNFKVKARFD